MNWTLNLTCRIPDDKTFDTLVVDLVALLDRHGIEERGIVIDHDRRLELVTEEVEDFGVTGAGLKAAREAVANGESATVGHLLGVEPDAVERVGGSVRTFDTGATRDTDEGE